MSDKFCPECGARNKAETRFCIDCGTRFPEETPLPAAEAAIDPPTEAAIDSLAEAVIDPQAEAAIDPPAEDGDAAVRDQDQSATSATDVPKKKNRDVPKRKKKKTGLVIIAIILVLIVAAGALLLYMGSIDKMLATVKSGRGDYLGALESYEKYLSRSGDKSTNAYTQASLYALSAGDADKALMYAKSVPEKSARADELAEKAALVLARNAIEKEDWDAAIRYLENIDGDEAEKLAEEVNYHLAIEAAERKEFETAIALLEDNSFDMSGDLIAEYRYNYGVSLMKEGKYEEAIAQFEKTDFADSDDLRGECYFKTSVDYAFLMDLKDVCFDIIGDGKSPESVERAAEKLGEYSNKLFNDSELAYFAEELRKAFLMECDINSKADQVFYDVYQKNLCPILANESECLEVINEMYPYAADDWASISAFFKSPDYWNKLVAVINQIEKTIDAIKTASPDSGNRYYIELNNNTDYEISFTFWFSIYDKNEKLLNKDQVSKTISAHSKAKIVFKAETGANTWACEFRIDDYK